MIKIFIVDDHYMVVEGIRSLLINDPSIDFTGSASSAESCRAFLKSRQPDVVLMDISLPDGNGIDLCREIKQLYPAVYVLGLSTFNQASFIKEMIDNGASGYILKNVTQKELTEAIHLVAAGKVYLAFDAAKTLQAEQRKLPASIIIGRREREVLNLIKHGFTNHEIAQQLGISFNTVDTYRKNLLLKLDAKNTADLVRIALLHKLITAE